jgi:hypothetical protein
LRLRPRGRFWSFAAAFAAALVVLLGVLALVPEQRDLAVQAYALFLGGLVLLWLLGGTRSGRPRRASSFDEARRKHEPRVERLPELARVEREVALGVGNAFDLHYRLRPRVRAVAATRLAFRRGIDLDRQAEAAQKALPPALWELVRGDRPVPHDRYGPGLGRADLRAVMDGLDRI